MKLWAAIKARLVGNPDKRVPMPAPNRRTSQQQFIKNMADRNRRERGGSGYGSR